MQNRLFRLHMNREIVSKLAEPPGRLKTRYTRTSSCSGFLRAENGALTGRYCRCRWCYICKPIRVANLMNGYIPQLQKLGKLYFLTLTTKKPTWDEYPERVDVMHDLIKTIRQDVRYHHGQKFLGLRKFETTYSASDYTFHPHFHLLLDNLEAAQLFRKLWLNRTRLRGIYTEAIAQDLREFSKDSYYEMFKYMSKDVSKESGFGPSGNLSKSVIDISMINHIWETLTFPKVRRIFQPYGIRKIPEDIGNVQSTFFTDPNYSDHFEFNDDTWYSLEHGDQLIPFQQHKRVSSLKALIQV